MIGRFSPRLAWWGLGHNIRRCSPFLNFPSLKKVRCVWVVRDLVFKQISLHLILLVDVVNFRTVQKVVIGIRFFNSLLYLHCISYILACWYLPLLLNGRSSVRCFKRFSRSSTWFPYAMSTALRILRKTQSARTFLQILTARLLGRAPGRDLGDYFVGKNFGQRLSATRTPCDWQITVHWQWTV